jgi:high-affinity nickel permease
MNEGGCYEVARRYAARHDRAAQAPAGAMSFDLLFGPVEELDAWLASLIDGAPLLFALAVAFVLGLRHASDPDHLATVTPVSARRGRRSGSACCTASPAPARSSSC